MDKKISTITIEYKVLHIDLFDPIKIQCRLNDMAADGWRLAFIANGTFHYFERLYHI